MATANRKKLEYETLYAKIKFQDMEISDTHRNGSITGSKVGNVHDSIGSLDSFLISQGMQGLEPKSKEVNTAGIIVDSSKGAPESAHLNLASKRNTSTTLQDGESVHVEARIESKRGDQ